MREDEPAATFLALKELASIVSWARFDESTPSLLALDVRLTDHPGILIRLLAQMRGKLLG